MSLATRCPACGTTFKVVRDQLRISDGWVRCGRCSEVFDATEGLHETADTDTVHDAPPAPVPEADPPVPPAAHHGDPAADIDPPPDPHDAAQGDDAETLRDIEALDLHDFDDRETGEASPPPTSPPMPSWVPAPSAPAFPFVGIVADEPWPELPSLELGEPPARTPAARQGFDVDPGADIATSSIPTLEAAAEESGRPDELGDADPLEGMYDLQLQKALRRARIKSVRIARARAKVPESRAAAVLQTASEPVGESPAGVASARITGASFHLALPEPAANRLKPRRRTLLVVAALASLLLVAQVLHHQRDALVARQPGLRPAFAAWCAVAGCQLSALRRIEDITIDGSAFAREKSGDGYQLSFTLRSHAAVPLAMPVIELSLLDTQERTVVRRVLTPADFGAPAVLAARGEQSASLPVTLKAAEAAALPPIAGYHIGAFYP